MPNPCEPGESGKFGLALGCDSFAILVHGVQNKNSCSSVYYVMFIYLIFYLFDLFIYFILFIWIIYLIYFDREIEGAQIKVNKFKIYTC